MRANERAWRSDAEITDGLLRIWHVMHWHVMQECVRRGCGADGVLPGGLRVRRRARDMREKLDQGDRADPLYAMERVTLYALGVNEENASGGPRRRPAPRLAGQGDPDDARYRRRYMHDKYKETARGGLAVNVIEC